MNSDATYSKEGSPFYIWRGMSALPLTIMIVPAIILVVFEIFSANIMIAGGVIGLMVCSLFVRDKSEYWDVVITALGDKTGLMAFALFLIVGVYAELLVASQLGEGVIWLAQIFNAGVIGFTLFIYITCSILATAMGTSVGVIFIMIPVLYPIAMTIGISPALAAGAILSGAATGDHFSPVSDTTLISSMTQQYKYREGSAGIGTVIKARMKYVIPAFLISCLMYTIAAYWGGHNMVTDLQPVFEQSDARGLVMIIPMIVVIYTAIRGVSVFQAITYGVASGLIIALGSGLIGWKEVFWVNDGHLSGILVKGALANMSTVMLIVLMMGAYGVMRYYGLINSLVTAMSATLFHSVHRTEVALFGIGTGLSFILIGLVTRVTVIGGPIINELGQRLSIDPSRRANILDAAANGLSYVMPWHIWPMLMLLTIQPLGDKYPDIVLPSTMDVSLYTIYPMAIWIIMLLSVVTGYGSKIEQRQDSFRVGS